jgi:hypothetical protein
MGIFHTKFNESYKLRARGASGNGAIAPCIAAHVGGKGTDEPAPSPANPTTPRTIFEYWADKSSKMTKSSRRFAVDGNVAYH